MGFFDKNLCDICGKVTGSLGSRKLKDGNICKECASKLSPWFTDRHRSSVEEIKVQLRYREANRLAVAAFNPTLALGKDTKVLIDEEAGTFVVSAACDLSDDNPDVVCLSQVKDCRVEIERASRELTRMNSEGELVSFVPPRYTYEYSFIIAIDIESLYFNEMRFEICECAFESTGLSGDIPAEYKECERLGQDIKKALMRI